MMSFSSRQILATLTCFAFVLLARSNTLGSPGDPGTQALLQECMSDNTTRYTEYGGKPGFGFGECPFLINCVLMGSNEENKAGMSAGAAIAALIPTMLALIGMLQSFSFSGAPKTLHPPASVFQVSIMKLTPCFPNPHRRRTPGDSPSHIRLALACSRNIPIRHRPAQQPLLPTSTPS